MAVFQQPPRNDVQSVAAPIRVHLFRTVLLHQYHESALRMADDQHTVIRQPRGLGPLRGDLPNPVKRRHPVPRALGDALAGIVTEPEEMHVKLVLAASRHGVDHECDGRVIAHLPEGRPPGKYPDAIRPPRVFNTGYPRAGNRKPMHKTGRATAHLHVAQRDEIGRLGPDLRRVPAFTFVRARAVNPRPAAGCAIIRTGSIHAVCYDCPEDCAVARGTCRQWGRNDGKKQYGGNQRPNAAYARKYTPHSLAPGAGKPYPLVSTTAELRPITE